MKGFFRFFVERHTLAMLYTIMMILLGIGAVLQIKRDIFPAVDFGQVVITTVYPGASPEDVELNVTNEIEDALDGIAGISETNSYSMENLSYVEVGIDLQARDKDAIRDDIREAVGRVTDLPPEVREKPQVTEIKSSIIPVIEVGLAGDASYRDLRRAARAFERKLEDASGVSRVEPYWNLDREVRVEIDPDAIEKYGISISEVSNALRVRNIRQSGGSFDSYTSRMGLLTLAQFRDLSEVEGAIVRVYEDGATVRVADMARVVDGFEEPRIVTRMNGKPAITFQVLKNEDADIIRTVDSVMEVVDEERAMLPEGVGFVFSNDLSYYVKNRFDVVLGNGGIGLLLVVVILTIFLAPRPAFWVALSIPVILLGVVFMLPLAGAHMDIIGLAAMILVIGIIVDDGIIVSENIVRKRELGLSPLDAASEGASEVAKPVFATLATTFLAFAPMFFMTGVFGEFVYSIPLVITLAVLISVSEVVVALPAHLVSGLRRIEPTGKAKEHWFEKVRTPFRKLVRLVLRLRYGFIALSIALAVGAVLYAAFFMDFVLFPSSAANAFQIQADLPPGSSLERTSDKVEEVEEIVASLPEDQIESFTTRVGSHGMNEPGEFENWATIRVDLTPFSKRGVTADEIVEGLRERTDALTGFERISYSVDAGGPPVGPPVTIRIVGADDEMRRALTDEVTAALSGMEGVKDIDRNDRLGKSNVRLDIDHDRLPLYGLSVADVSRTVRLAYDGEIATSVRMGDEDVDYRVLLESEAREDLSMLERLTLRGRDGSLVRLATVASFVDAPGPTSIYHFDGLRTTTVNADVDKEVTTPLEVTRAVERSFDLDRDWPGMRFVIGGESEETAESFKSLGIAFAIAIVGIFFVLVLLFDSFTQPFLVMVAIPFGIIAVIIAFAIHGQTPGFLAALGLVGLMGVVVNDSLVMVSHINELRKDRPDEPIIDLVAIGASNRLRAIVITTITTVVGLIPLAYGIGGSDPFIAPMALALGYGLLFSTPLTLLLIPCFYMVREDVGRLPARLLRAVRRGKTPAREVGPTPETVRKAGTEQALQTDQDPETEEDDDER